MPDPATVGVLSNPAGRHNARGGLRAVEAVLATAPAVVHRLAREPRAMETALAELAAAGVRQLAVNGGDGTVQAVLTTLALRSPFVSPPQLLLLAGGTTNMSARDIGSHGRPGALLRALLAGRLVVTPRRVLTVREADGTARCGFFLTAGGLPQAVRDCRAFREHARLPGLRSALGTALWVSGRVLRLLVGRASFQSQPIDWRTEGAPRRHCDALVLLATTHRRLALGLRPWWGAGAGSINVTAIGRPARRLALALPGVLRGRPPAWAGVEAGYASCRTDALELTAAGGYALDGEDYLSPAATRLRIDAGPTFEFLRP
ncbi:MAG: diacylglycerol kinase family protein [Immundisolibacter sp.]